MENKNNKGIKQFMVSETLFRNEYGNLGRSSFVSSNQKQAKSGSNSRVRYNWTNQKLKQEPKNEEEEVEEPMTKRKQHTSKQSSIYIRENSPIKTQQSISSRVQQVHKPTISDERQGVQEGKQIVRSSRKYFDSCRLEGHEYILKMETILSNDNILVQKAIQQIREYVHDSHQQQGEKLKEDLYLAVDEAVERWKAEEMRNSHLREVDYLGELLQLSTQIQERMKQMTQYKLQLDDERNWKQRASDLLTSSYEEDITDLSKQCQKSVIISRQSVQKGFKLQNSLLVQKIAEYGKQNLIINIKQQILNKILRKTPEKQLEKSRIFLPEKFELSKQLEKLQRDMNIRQKIYKKKEIFQQSRKNSEKSVCSSCKEKYRTQKQKDSK